MSDKPLDPPSRNLLPELSLRTWLLGSQLSLLALVGTGRLSVRTAGFWSRLRV